MGLGNYEALIASSLAGHIEVVQLLLARGAQVCSEDLVGACLTGHTETVELMLNYGAKIAYQQHLLWGTMKLLNFC